MNKNKWQRFQMPESLEGQSFLDVGCWEGEHCVEAVHRGARRVVGVDLCPSDSLARNLRSVGGFEFVQVDVFSEKFLHLDAFDVVLCSGVLYHVEDPLSLLRRLRKVCRGRLILETAITPESEGTPIMRFFPGGRDLSRWWVPNQTCLVDMLEGSGFGDVRPVWDKEANAEGLRRLCVHADAIERRSYARLLPRAERFMTIHGGERQGRKAS